jgi:hypothetical protein
VADKVLGIGPCIKSSFHDSLFFPAGGGAPLSPYSSNKAHAIGVLDGFVTKGHEIHINYFRGKWSVRIGEFSPSVCKTLSLAICLAALKAVGVEPSNEVEVR